MSYQSLRSEAISPTPSVFLAIFNRFALRAIRTPSAAVTRPSAAAHLAVLILETGLRIGEALGLEWGDLILEALPGARFGYLKVRDGKSKNARRTVPLTDRAASMLRTRRREANVAPLVFTNRGGRQY